MGINIDYLRMTAKPACQRLALAGRPESSVFKTYD
jgi:hypothetical protein